MQTCDESLFWYWIEERHKIYVKKAAGEPKPWTSDPIFQQYKFVNVSRRLDKTTRWMLSNFEPHRNSRAKDLMFNICWYRMFNRWETGAHLGWQVFWDKDWVKVKLRELQTLFTGAYIIHSEPGMSKLDSIVDVCGVLHDLMPVAIDVLYTVNRMEAVSEVLQKARHVGDFMAYQMVLDMMYFPALLGQSLDRDSWACTGPGALRGLRRLDPSVAPRDSLAAMHELTDKAREKAPVASQWLNGLDIHDIEFCLCELDKYCRVKYGEGRPRQTYPGGA